MKNKLLCLADRLDGKGLIEEANTIDSILLAALWPQNKTLDSIFDVVHKKVVRKEEKIVPITIPLYRGFNGDLESIKTEGDFYILSPEKSEQGMLWFTHPYISHYDPIEYAKGHGKWFMTYNLEAKKHIEIEHNEDGTTTTGRPEYFSKLSNPASNSRYWAGIELPEGWFFTYKNEKFIGCKIKIKVKKNAVVSSD